MSIAPIVHTIVVKAPPPRAFDLFVSHMAQWWPRGRTIAKAPHVAIVVEPRAGGQWFERDANGNEVHWGKVLEWDPPSRVLFLWQINTDSGYDAKLRTEVELTFVPADGGGTTVRLEHRKLEAYGADAARHTDRFRNGWPVMLSNFVTYADEQR